MGRKMLLTGTALLLAGCGWIRPRSDFERDPFVMSHLTKGNEGAYAADDLDGRRGILSASTSRKRVPPLPSARDTQTGGPTPSAHASDFSWVRGRLLRQRDEIVVQYADGGTDDEFGGRLRLEKTPELGLFRSGDFVVVTGEVVASRPGDARYRVRSVALAD